MNRILTIRNTQKEVREWAERNFADTWEEGQPMDPFLGIVEEVGEISHAILKFKQGIREYDANKMHSEVRDGIGDLFIYMCDFCSRMGYDFQEIVEITWDQVKQRDWNKQREEPDAS